MGHTRIRSILQAALFHIGTGNIDFIPVNAVAGLQKINHGGISLVGIPEHIDHTGHIMCPHFREQVLIDADIPRFAALGVIASMQPTHCITDKRFAEKRIGHDRCRGAYAWRRLLDANAHIAFGTDWPVEPVDPLEGLYAAVTRKDRAGEPGEGWFPDQRLSMEEAIELYTLGAAYAEFSEDRKGMIRQGYLADLVIFDRDLLTIPPEQIMQAHVETTIVGGHIVYQHLR